MKCILVWDDFAIPNRARTYLSHIFRSSYEYFFHHQNWRFSCSLSGHIGLPPIMLTVDFWARNPILFGQHVSFGCPFLDPHLTMYQTKMCVHIICCVGIRCIYLRWIFLFMHLPLVGYEMHEQCKVISKTKSRLLGKVVNQKVVNHVN